MVMIAMVVIVAMLPSRAQALLPQTQKDLQVAEDRLRYELERAPELASEMTPILIVPPQSHWEESKADFAASVMDMLGRAFPSKGALIPCADCRQNRTYVSRDNRTVIQNGELSLADLAFLRTHPGYEQARSLLVTRETPSGIELRWISIEDGRILFLALADASQTLSDAHRPLRLAQETERRKRGEALSYVFMDIGVYPGGLAQLKWLEQWGSRNQHLSGLAIGLYNPTGAIGGAYHYMLPGRRQTMIALTGYYKLAGVFTADSKDSGANLVGQAMLQHAISGSYGVFVSADTSGTVRVGFSLLNPVLLPFLL